MSDIMRKLAKMLRGIESRSEREAQTIMAQAQRMAAKYAVDLAAVSIDDNAEREQAARTSDIQIGKVRQRKYRWQLATAVAEAYGCAPWLKSRYDVKIVTPLRDDLCPKVVKILNSWFDDHLDGGLAKRGVSASMPKNDVIRIEVLYRQWPHEEVRRLVDRAIPVEGNITRGVDMFQLLTMVGPSGLAEAAIYVYSMLVNHVDQLATRRNKVRREQGLSSGRTILRSLRLGLVSGLKKRLVAEEQGALSGEGEVQETAMVLVKTREESTRYLADAFGSDPFQSRTTYSTVNVEAYDEGQAAAGTIDIPDSNGARSDLLRAGRALTDGSD